MPKVVKRLAEMQVRNAKPAEKNYKLYDGDGLCLLVRTTGTKVWQFPYKFASKRTVYTIGKYIRKNAAGHIGLQDAREACHEIRSLIEQGINPNERKQAQISGAAHNVDNTFEALGREWHGKGTWVPKHAKNILRSLEADVFAYIGTKDITDVTRHDIIDILSRVEDRNAMYVAKRISKRCEDIFDYAIIKGLCENNPALGSSRYIKLPKATPRPHLKEAELPEFLGKLSKYHGRDYIRMGMQLLVLTFLRPGELRNLRWSDIDEKNATILIPKERMKMSRDHSVPLSKQALTLIKELKKITGNNALLFPSVKSHHQPISDVTLTKVLRVMGYEGDKKIVPHGFRHTASTILNENGFNRDHIERQLAHVETNKVRGAYNHAEYIKGRTEMMQWWANYLDGLIK
jgi:integrase